MRSELDGRPDEALRPMTRRMAESLANDDGARMLAQLQVLGLNAAGMGLARARSAPMPSFGIWGARRSEGGEVELVRDRAQTRSFRFWADVERVGPKRGPRIVLLGESAARGYLYDPAITPASMLSAMLGGVEVVDLAASDLGSDGLDSLIAAVPALAPDAIVVFAGNNWHNVAFALDEVLELAASYRAGGTPAARLLFLERMVLPRARTTLDALAAAAAGVPVVVVVPEFSLGEWRADRALRAPVLAGGRDRRWMELRADALRARDSGDHARTGALGRELVALDSGVHPLGLELVGAAARAEGKIAEARAAFEAARDSVVGTFVAHAPRCPTAVQAAIRERASRHGFDLVDLPALFARELQGDLPDRRLFLDYCHLTVRGIALAMGAAADALSTRLGLARHATLPTVAPTAESTAHFLAAIHCAHQGQGDGLLRYHLERAAELDAGALDQIEWFLGLEDAAAEPWLCAGFDRLTSSPQARRYLDATDPRVSSRLADAELNAVMGDVLRASGRTARALAIAEGPVDLLDPRHSASSFGARHGQSFGPTRAYTRAVDVTSRFTFRAVGRNARLRIVCRRGDVAGKARVRLNGATVGTIALEARWVARDLTVATRVGANDLEIDWPLGEPDWSVLIEAGARRLERGLYPDALPAYGEIYELVIV